MEAGVSTNQSHWMGEKHFLVHIFFRCFLGYTFAAAKQNCREQREQNEIISMENVVIKNNSMEAGGWLSG